MNGWSMRSRFKKGWVNSVDEREKRYRILDCVVPPSVHSRRFRYADGGDARPLNGGGCSLGDYCSKPISAHVWTLTCVGWVTYGYPKTILLFSDLGSLGCSAWSGSRAGWWLSPIHPSEQNCYLASRQNMNSVRQGSKAPQAFDLNCTGDMVTESHGYLPSKSSLPK